MRAETCPTCGGAADPTRVCPHCRAVPGSVATALADVEREIAELAARDVRIQTERTELSQRMQAAMHRRALLANAEDLRQRHTGPPRGVRRRRMVPAPRYGGGPTRPVPGAPPRPVAADTPTRPPAPVGPADAEASTRSVQTVLLLLGALLLGVSATVFAGVAISAVGGLARAAILLAAAVLALGVPPRLAARGLVATAETVAAVGLLLVPLVGSALWGVAGPRPGGLSGHTYAALVCAATAAVAAWYAAATGLAAPRYATLLAVQPVLPLAAYPHVRADAAWALVFAAVALVDLLLARALPTRLARWAQVRRPRPVPPARPESAAEEPDAIVGGHGAWQPAATAAPAATAPPAAASTGPRAPRARSAQATVLARLSWVLHLAAGCLGLAFGAAALSDARTIGAAVAGWLATVAVAAVTVAAAHGRDLAALSFGLLTLALVAGAARVAALAWPAPAPVAAAVVVAVAAALLHAVARDRRRGPRWGAAVVLAAVLAAVAGAALRSAADALAAARPAWHADLRAYDIAASQGPALLAAALVAAAATALLAAPGRRREWTAVPLVLAGLAAPGALALPWPATPWPATAVAVTLAALAVTAPRDRTAHALVAGAGFAAVFAAGTSLARPDLTAAVLGTLGCAGVLVLLARRPLRRSRTPLAGALHRAAPGAAADWVAAGTLLAVTGAVAAVLAGGGASHPARLTGAALVVCAGLLAGAFAQVRRRIPSAPLALAGALGGLGVTVGALRPGVAVVDAAIGVLLVAAALSMPLAPALDARRRSDRRHDGADIAAAAAVAATIAALARAASLAVPAAPLLTASVFVAVVALTTRVLPAGWRRGPVLGLAAAGGVLALWVAAGTMRDGLRVLAAPGPVWHSDLSGMAAAGPHDWQVPLAALVLAVAAAATLPRPARYDVAATLVGLATIATPAALGLPWWSPIVIDGAVASGYAVAARAARDPRAGLARAVVGAAVALHAVAAGLVRPWTTAAALALLAVLGALVAGAGRGDPRRRVLAGGGAATALLAAPGAVACAAASLRLPTHAALSLGMAAAVAGLLAAVAVRRAAPYLLPYLSAGIAGGATAVALAALPSGRVARYAAGAVLLGVLAEVLRHRTRPPHASAGRPGARWRVPPARGAVAAAAVPGLLAVGVLTPPLWVALTAPGATWRRVWQGPPPALVALGERPDVTPAAVLAAALLTLAAAVAVRGFTDRHTAEAVPVLLPGLGLTLLIAPLGFHLPWPAVTLAALLTFVVLLLGVALTPPPPPVDGATPVTVGRVAAVALGLAAGTAGLAGSLATEPLTLTTLGGAVVVGVVAGYAGRTPLARILGWLFGAVSALALALTAGLAAGWPVHWSAFGVLAAGAALLIAAATLPRFGRPAARGEAQAVEWSAYAAAVLAAALAARSSPHLAAVLAGWGAVLGLAAGRRGRAAQGQRTLFWVAIGCEVAAWWLLMWVADVPTVEVYTLPFAAVALAVGVWEERRRPELSSWLAYGPALVAAFVPTLVVVVTGSSPLRQVLLLLGAVATLVAGSARRKQAPVVVGAVVTTLVALHALVQFGPWLVLLPVGVLLLWFGADNEKRRRDVRRLHGAVRTMT